MKKYIKYIIIILVIILIVTIVIVKNIQRHNEKQDDGKFKIVTSFYPIYIMTANITQGAQNIDLTNMTDVSAGCIHDYTLTTSDMKKIENANVFIQNGLGLESFTQKVIDSNKNLQVINSSENITDLIKQEDNINPHVWTSMSNYIMGVETITKQLSEKNPENAQIYEKNCQEYVEKLNNLKSQYSEQLQLNGRNAVILDESFSYFAKDLGLNLIVISNSHQESAISAETLKNTIEKIKQNENSMIIVDMNDDLKNAETIAKETGAKIYKLDSATTGSLNKQAYIDSMTSNLINLKDN